MFTILLSFAACNNPGTQHQAAIANIHKAYEALSKKDFQTFGSLCADDFTELSLGPQPIKGLQNAINQYKLFFDAFPDFKVEVVEIAPADNNRYFLRVHTTGTNTGSLMNLPPTAKHIDLWDMDIVEINKDGKAISHYVANPNGVMSAIGYGSMANPNTAIVIAAYEAFGKKDVPAILNLCSDDIKFEIHDQTLDPKGPHTYKGKTEAAQFFSELGSKIAYSSFVPSRFIADGDDVAIIINAEFKEIKTGKNYTVNYNHHFHITDGKIVYIKGVADMPQSK
jgi:ketosteroid isomerase-like protein